MLTKNRSQRIPSREHSVPACLSYIVEGNRIRLPGNSAGVKFDFPIGDVVEAGDAIVICLSVSDGRTCSENVYAIDHGGNLRWRIQSPPFGARSGPYMDLSIEGAVVRLQGKGGRAYCVNSKDESFIGS